MGAADSKQFIPLLGSPAIAYTIAAFQECPVISDIVVVCRAQDTERISALCRGNGFNKVIAVTEGGDSRAQSVKNGVAAAKGAQYLAIHDGARPLVTPDEIACVCEAAFETGAAALGTPVTDTVKVVDENGVIQSTPSRESLRAMQTPQVFEREFYTFALENAGEKLDGFTDDCALIENMGGEVSVIDGSRENIKLTTPIDIVIAESILRQRGQQA